MIDCTLSLSQGKVALFIDAPEGMHEKVSQQVKVAQVHFCVSEENQES